MQANTTIMPTKRLDRAAEQKELQLQCSILCGLRFMKPEGELKML